MTGPPDMIDSECLLMRDGSLSISQSTEKHGEYYCQDRVVFRFFTFQCIYTELLGNIIKQDFMKK